MLLAGGRGQVFVDFQAAVDNRAQRRRQLVERRALDLRPQRLRQQHGVGGELPLHLFQRGPQLLGFGFRFISCLARAVVLPVPAAQRRFGNAGLTRRAGGAALAGIQRRHPALALGGSVVSAHANPSLITYNGFPA